MRRRKAPPNTYWRGETLWGRIKVKGRLTRWSLRTGDVEVAAARVKAEREHAIAVAHFGDARPRYVDVVTAWAERHINDQVSASTAARYAVSLGQLEPHLMDCYLDEIDSRKIKAIVTARRDAGASIATVRRDLTALSSVLEFAIDEGHRDEADNPALSRLKRLKERRDPIILPDHAFIEKVIKRASPKMEPLIRTALATGCRLSELTTAARAQLDHVRRQLTVIGKGNKRRTVDLDFGGAYEILRAVPAHISGKWLFWHHDGEPYKAVSVAFHELVRAQIAETQKEAQARGAPIPELHPFRFHDLRHRHAVDYLKAGRSIYMLQKRLGHRSIKTTEIYLDFLTPEEQQLAMFGEGAEVTQTESQPKRSA